MLWRVQSIVRGFPDLAHASKPKAATNEPGSGGIDGGIFLHWPSEQLRGLIRPAATSISPYLCDEQHEDDRDLIGTWLTAATEKSAAADTAAAPRG